MDNWNSSRLGWLALASFPGFGERILQMLHDLHQGDGEAAWKTSETTLQTRIRKRTCVEAFLTYRRNTTPILLKNALEKQRIQFILQTDADYPLALKQQSRMPFGIFVRGSLNPLQSPCLSIVGTRSMTSYGKQITKQITTDCCGAGITIISGLALGIDGEAHQAALDAEGKTIAVLGSGVNPENVYPRQHAQLAEEIIRKGGALISESAPGYKAFYFDFPLRNRMIAGLSQATLVIEGAHKSGSLITAHLATEQGKDVLAVPGPINAKQSEGTNALIKNGAIPCLGIDTILETLHLEPSITSQEHIELTTDEQALLAHITHPRKLDEIAQELRQPISHIMRLVSHLELKGLLLHSDSRHIVRTAHKF